MTSTPVNLMLVATGGVDGWVTVSDVTGVIPNSAAFIYDHDSGPVSVVIYDIDVPGKRLLLWSNGMALNASGYTPSNGATVTFPGGSYLNPSVPINTSGIAAPYVLTGNGDTVPFTVNAALNQTTKLQSWQVAGRETSFIDKDGLLVGPIVWQTLPKDPTSAVSPIDLPHETFRDSDQYMVFLRHSVEDSMSFTWTMPHGWCGDVVIPHIHIIPCADPPVTAYVYFKAAWVWTTEAGVVPPYDQWTHITPFVWAVNPGDINKTFKIAFPSITVPTQPPEVKQLIWHFERPGHRVQDTYNYDKDALPGQTGAANLAILGIDLHYQSLARGSVSIDGGPYDPAPVNLGEPPPLVVQSLAPIDIPFTVEGSIGQTAKLQSWGVNGVELAYVDNTGHFFSGGVPVGGGVTAPYTLQGVGDTVPFTINAISGQTAKLFSWGVNGVEKASINAFGALQLGTDNTSPVLATLITGTDADFSGPGNWVSDPVDAWYVSGGSFYNTPASLASATLPTCTPTAGKWYRLLVYITTTVPGLLSFIVGGGYVEYRTYTTASNYPFTVMLLTTDATPPIIYDDGVWAGSINGISLTEFVSTPGAALSIFSTNSTSLLEIRPTGISTYIGQNAGLYASTAGNNLALGNNTLMQNVGGNSVAIGANALQQASTALNNTAIGADSLALTQSGHNNVGIGTSTLWGNVTGGGNIAIGATALSLADASSNIAIGAEAMAYTRYGSFNVAIGAKALYSSGLSASPYLNFTKNTAIGAEALYSAAYSSFNTAIGYQALRALGASLARAFIIVGRQYVINTTSNTDWVAMGAANNDPGTLFTATSVGTGNGTAFPVDGSNVAIGTQAGQYYQSGGSLNTSAMQGVYIGYTARASAINNTNEIVIGYNALGNGSNTVTLGNSSITKLFTYGAITSPILNSASAVGTIIDTNQSYSTTGAKLLSIRNAGVEKAYIDKDGVLAISSEIKNVSTGIVRFSGSMADGPSAVAVILASSVSLSNPTAQLVGFQNAGIYKASIFADGTATFGGISVARGGGNVISNLVVGSGLTQNLTGGSITAVGYNTLAFCKGSQNVGIGTYAGNLITTGINNVVIGANAFTVDGGTSKALSDNTIIGANAGYDADDCNSCTFIGANAGMGLMGNTVTNVTAIGYNASVWESNSITLGDSSVTKLFTSAAITAVASDGATAVGTVIDTYGSYVTAGSKLLSIRNAGIEKAYIDKDGGGFLSSATTIKGTTLTDVPSLGAEILDANNWTSVGWTGSWVTGWTHTAGNVSALSQTNAAVIGTAYTISWTTTGRTAGYFTIAFGGMSRSTIPLGASGSFTGVASTTTGLVVTPNTAFNGTLVISVKLAIASVPLLSLKASDGVTYFEMRVPPATGNILMGIGSGGLIGSLGTGNLAIGSGALQYNVQGVDNVALGTDALKFCTTSYAVAIGPRALAALTSGAGNLAIGEAALQNLTTGADNTAIGRRALNSIQTSNSNVAIGASSLYSNTGQGNIGIGVEALYSNQTGQGNVAIGYGAARSGTLGTYNVAIGQNTLWSNLTGVNNVAIGLTAMYLGKSSYNVAIGDSALNVIDTGNGNIALGSESGLKLTTGEHNILIGWGCGKLTSIGEDNTALTQSILIGGNAYPLGLSETNEIVIGYEALGNGSNTITLGNSLATKLFTYAAITSPVPDGAAAVGTVIDTFESFATTGAKLLSIRNAGVEQAYMDKNALLVIGGNGSYGGVSVSSQYNPVMLRAENRASGSSTAGAFLGLFHNTLGGGSIMQSGHRMGGFFFGGNSGDDTNLRNSAGVFGFATETWVNLTGYGSAISFATTANGSTTRSEKMRLDHSGYLGLGVTSPTAALHVKSVTADGASAIATIIDTSVAWSTSGAKLVSFQNASAEKAYIDKDGLITSGGSPVGRKVAVPATAGATGSVGDWAADASWLYICTATNTWQRTAITLATW